MKDDAATDQAPTVPAIPLRTRQRHRARSRKTETSSRWLSRREAPVVEREEVPLESATFETVVVEPAVESDFFQAGDSVAPVVHDEEEPEPLPFVHAPRRGLAAIVIGAVALAAVLCVAAVAKPRAPVAATVAVTPTPAVEIPAPPAAAEVPPPEVDVPAPAVVAEAPVVPATELRESARAALTKRQLPEAIAAASAATKAEPEDAEGWLLLGAAQLEAGRSGDARESFRTCTHVAKSGPVGECRSFAR